MASFEELSPEDQKLVKSFLIGQLRHLVELVKRGVHTEQSPREFEDAFPRLSDYLANNMDLVLFSQASTRGEEGKKLLKELLERFPQYDPVDLETAWKIQLHEEKLIDAMHRRHDAEQELVNKTPQEGSPSIEMIRKIRSLFDSTVLPLQEKVNAILKDQQKDIAQDNDNGGCGLAILRRMHERVHTLYDQLDNPGIY